MSCLTTGNAKVQWNACHAMANLFRNPTTAAGDSAWSPLVVRMLLMLLRDTRNFKIRMHAAATLATLGERCEFGNAYPDTVSIVTVALESLESLEPSLTGDSAPNDGGEPALADLRYKPQLGAQLGHGRLVRRVGQDHKGHEALVLALGAVGKQQHHAVFKDFSDNGGFLPGDDRDIGQGIQPVLLAVSGLIGQRELAFGSAVAVALVVGNETVDQ